MGDICFHVNRNSSCLVRAVSCNSSAAFSVSHADYITNFALEAGDVNELAVYHDVTMRNHLASLEDCLGITETPNQSCKSKFEKAKEVQAGVAVHSLSLFEGVAKLLFKNVVVASNNLFGQQLLAILRLSCVSLARAMLTHRISSLGARAFCLTPNIEADNATDIVFTSSIGCHNFKVNSASTNSWGKEPTRNYTSTGPPVQWFGKYFRKRLGIVPFFYDSEGLSPAM